MTMVRVTAPADSGKASYGAINFDFGGGGSDGVPAYIGRYLVANYGFTCDVDLSKIDIEDELAHSSALELQYYLHAMGQNGLGLSTPEAQEAAQKVFAKRGVPKDVGGANSAQQSAKVKPKSQRGVSQ